MKREHFKNTRDEKTYSPLISARALNDILGLPHVKIFDVRGIWGTNPQSLYDEYAAGHIPTARFLDWRKEFIEMHIAPGLAQVASFTEAKQSFVDLGIDKEDTVILYDDYHHMFAGRIWWAMRYWGFDNVLVLNGGFNYWQLENLPVSQEVPIISKGSFEPVCQAHLRQSLEDFLVEKDNAYVLDGRGIASYNGKTEDSRTGHIPGAISTAYHSLIDKDTGLFLEATEITALFDSIIPNWRTKKIICSCGAGYSATIVMLALVNLGIPSSLFDGSFNEWKKDPNRPISQSS